MEDELLDNNTELWFTGWKSVYRWKSFWKNGCFKSIAELVEKI
jgi:hypothetical protein